MVLPLENIEKGLVLAKNIADKIGCFASSIACGTISTLYSDGSIISSILAYP